MDHSEVNIIRLHPAQKILKKRLHDLHVHGTTVLSVFPDRAKMSLNVHFVALSLERGAKVRADVWIGHKAIQQIDTGIHCSVHGIADLLQGLAFKILAAKTDF